MFKHRFFQKQGDRFCEEGIDEELFPVVYLRIKKSGPVPNFDIRYFKYRNIKNTLRIRSDKVYIRISDFLRGAPASVISAVYEILLCRTFRLSGYHHANLIYNTYIGSREFLGLKSRAAEVGSRIKKSPPAGKIYNLDDRFIFLNKLYFGGKLRNLDLHWAQRRSKRILGQFVPHRDEILINALLDHPLVPGSVVDFILYHEMLHAVLEPRFSKTGRKSVHHREFKRMEKEFDGYAYANQFIRENF
jgi:hypothetical protein